MLSLSPMLAENAGKSRLLELVADDRYALEEKLDGHRTLVHKPAGEVAVVIGRNGQASQHNDKFLAGRSAADLPSRRARELSRIPHDVILDGELIGEVFHIFDMPSFTGIGLVEPTDSWEHRRASMCRLLLDWEPDPTLFRLVESATFHQPKIELAMQCLRNDAEGLMAKLKSAPYRSGRRSTGSLKIKFTEDAEFEIVDLGFEGRNNAVLGVYHDGEQVLVGRAKTSDKHNPKVGEVWTVRFLRFNEHDEDESGRLYQPRLICKRTDKSPGECLYSQLVARKEVTA